MRIVDMVVYLAFSTCGQIDPAIEALLKDSIIAHGGKAALEKPYTGYHSREEGTWYTEDGESLRFTSEFWSKGADRGKLVKVLTLGPDRRMEIIGTSCGKRMYLTVDNVAVQISKAQLAQSQQEIFRRRIRSLFPLLEDDKLKLTLTHESKFEELQLQGINVESPKFNAVVLLFDKKTKLLSGQKTVVIDADEKPMEETVYYIDYKRFDGILWPAKTIQMARAGKKVEETKEISFNANIDEAIFARIDPAAEALVNEAINAHGGKASLEKQMTGIYVLREAIATARGEPNSSIKSTREYWFKGADHWRFVEGRKNSDQGKKMIIGVSGEKVFLAIDDQLKETPKMFQTYLQQRSFEQRIQFLVPLLEDDNLKISVSGESMFEGMQFRGIRVESPPFHTVELLFDKKTKLLSVSVRRRHGPCARRAGFPAPMRGRRRARQRWMRVCRTG